MAARTTRGRKSAKHSSRVIGIKLSRNFGHQSALLAAMENLCGSADLYATIDVDLQDNPDVIEAMVEKTNNGSAQITGSTTDFIIL